MVNDLALKSLKAHYLYMYPRFHNKEEQRGFDFGMMKHINLHTPPPFKTTGNFLKGERMAHEVYTQVTAGLDARFVTGRGEGYRSYFYWEKL